MGKRTQKVVGSNPTQGSSFSLKMPALGFYCVVVSLSFWCLVVLKHVGREYTHACTNITYMYMYCVSEDQRLCLASEGCLF